ncbi:pesticin C-terminus-like muramidase [Paraburkholderia sp. IW21]|uniref:pesticin C-terminus-like muramidase n=1 Tax=Paraburkholderia sp. IW21 TaxID=3242488 RepID=UPI0035212BA9
MKGEIAGFPPSATVLHIHPIGLIANFSGCPPTCKTEVFEFETTEGTFRISKKSFQFILSNEGYKDHPYVPGGDQSSGVTIGYGYDLGQQSPAQIATDLNDIFSPAQITRLQRAAGKHGDQARHIQPSLADIPVTMDMALRLATVMKRRYAQQTVDAFPGASNLHPHCSGALLDLVINRGPGMQDKPGQKTRVHMRAIRADISANNVSDVPLQLRAMKTLWESVTQKGLLIRRDEEANLFEEGMNCNCWR